MSTIFTKIINGEIPAYKLYENEHVCAFLDAFPQQAGHTLIVPKIEIDHFSEVPSPYYEAIFDAAKKLSPAIQQATNCKRITTRFEGFEIPHCHFHLIPANEASDSEFKKVEKADEKILENMQQSILNALK